MRAPRVVINLEVHAPLPPVDGVSPLKYPETTGVNTCLRIERLQRATDAAWEQSAPAMQVASSTPPDVSAAAGADPFEGT